MRDLDDISNKHRSVLRLRAVYPGNEINWEHTGTLESRASVDDLSLGCRYRIESRLEDQFLGTFPGRGSFGSINLDFAESVEGQRGQLSQSF